MIIIRNSLIPVRGYKALTVWPFIFVHGDLSDADLNHERIHGRQQVEMLMVLFLVWYGVEWMVRLCQQRDAHRAYRRISLEREAYENEADGDYLKHRRLYAWTKYL